MMRFFQKRGVVAKITGNSCIVLSQEGTYARVRLPSPEIKVGAEILYRVPILSKPLKPMMMVASILILFMSFYLVNQVFIPQEAVAYVSLDIDPSLEMSVDKNMRVIEVYCFNDSAINLIESLNLEGQKLDSAITEVINQAIDMNYVKLGQENVMISSISSSQEPSPIDQEAIYQVMEESLVSRGYSGRVKIYTTNEDIHAAAKGNNISAGKYIIYEQLVKSGKDVSLDDVNWETVGQLARVYKLDLLSEDDEITTTTVQIDHSEVNSDSQELVAGGYEKNQENVNLKDRENDNRQNDNVSRSYSLRKSKITQNISTYRVTDEKESLVENRIKGMSGVKKNESTTSNSANGVNGDLKSKENKENS